MKIETILAFTAMTVLPFCGRSQNINDLLNQWNIVTSGDLKAVNDYSGSAYVGGNVTKSTSFDVGKGVSNPSTVSLAVAGNIVSGSAINVDGGSVAVGGSANGRNFNMNSSGTLTQGNPSLLPASPVDAIMAASLSWSTLTPNSSISLSSSALNLNCGSGDLAVFNVSAADLFVNNKDLHLVLSSGTKDVIINVSGDTMNTGNSKFTSLQAMDEHVIFNFYQATSVDFGSESYGYVVAPGADVTSDNNFNGGIMAKSLSAGEVHLAPWEGDVPSSSVPEPTTWFAGASTLGMLGFGLFRQRKAQKTQ